MNDVGRETMFAWPRRTRSSWRLAVLILVMLLLHSAAFFLFQAATPRISPPPRTAPSLQILTEFGPDGRVSEENRNLLQWIESEDPALVARIPEVPPPPAPVIPYRPSYADVRTPPLELPEEAPTVQFPAARDALTIIQSGMPRQSPLPAAVAKQATRVRFASPLQSRLPAPPAFQPRTIAPELVEPTRFLIAVAPEGDVRFVFPQRPESGSVPALEKEAAAYLGSLTFTPRHGTGMIWGDVSVEWGDEIAPAP